MMVYRRYGLCKKQEFILIKKEEYRGKEYEALSGAAVLLFGKNPQRFFQRAQVRVIRFDGTEAKVGTEMNVVKDEIFTGPILKLTNDVLAFVRTQIKEHTYLGQDCLHRSIGRMSLWCMLPLGRRRMLQDKWQAMVM